MLIHSASDEPVVGERRKGRTVTVALAMGTALVALFLACGIAYLWFAPSPVDLGPYTVIGPHQASSLDIFRSPIRGVTVSRIGGRNGRLLRVNYIQAMNSAGPVRWAFRTGPTSPTHKYYVVTLNSGVAVAGTPVWEGAGFTVLRR